MQSTSSKFAALSNQFMKESLALSPTNASQAGYHKHLDPNTGKTIELDAQLDDLSLDAMATQRAFYARWRERFRAETPVASLDAQDAADWQLLDDQIGLQLLEFDKIQSYRHNPTVSVELIGNALFLPLTQNYAPHDVRVGHTLARVREVPRLVGQVKQYLSDADPIFVKTAVEENDGNVDLIETTIAGEIPAGSPLKAEYDRVAPPAIAALKDFSAWLTDDLGKRPSNLSWRLGKELYDQKFRLVMETDIKPEQLLADAEHELEAVRAEMLELAAPMHRAMYPDHGDHADLTGRDRQNRIIGEVLQKISDEHPRRDQLQQAIEADLEGIKQFIREKKIVSLGSRENLKVISTPPFMRGSYSVAGFHSAPPLEPQARAEYWVTPIDPKTPDAQAESKLREYNNYTLKWLSIHEALPGHYVQAEHANNIQPEDRRLLRALNANGAYVEGWAEYIAQVMMDEGYLNYDPKFRMVMRKLRLRLLGNTILDVRMQTMGMTDEQAMELMTQQGFQTQAEAEGKLRRAKLSSTQLPTYYVGLREWFAFRKRYQEEAGKNFDMLKFHDLVLDQGPLPVPAVEKLVMH
ncbi:MAG TPA: DUF885 domain-containing protein [Candidatus Sulfotelmatobacter sp.]|nr:DUF885 domain-containing protein [Candidatus Sulfotelmatobacter sp.]